MSNLVYTLTVHTYFHFLGFGVFCIKREDGTPLSYFLVTPWAVYSTDWK